MRFGLPSVVSIVTFAAAVPALAQFTPISTPDAAYTGSTTLLPITAANGTTNVSSLTDGTMTLTLATPLQAAQATVSGWSTWNSPPNAETAAPKVLARYSTLDSQTITLSPPSSAFGMEIEPNTFGAFAISVAFMNGGTTLGTVSRNPNGASGSLLYAASSGTPITHVVIAASSGGNGYALAQFRYRRNAQASEIPVLGMPGLIGLGMLLAAAGVRMLRR